MVADLGTFWLVATIIGIAVYLAVDVWRMRTGSRRRIEPQPAAHTAVPARPVTRRARWRSGADLPPSLHRVVVVFADRGQPRTTVGHVNLSGEWRESERATALPGPVLWWTEVPEHAPGFTGLRMRVASFVRRHRDVVGVALLMLGVLLIADAYTPAGAYSRARVAAGELALGVGALALAWIVYRGPRS